MQLRGEMDTLNRKVSRQDKIPIPSNPHHGRIVANSHSH
jgi:hypothetical protein